MDYRNILPLVSHTQEFSTDYWNDFGYWNDGTFWYEKTPTYTARVTAYSAATGITDYTILDPLNIFDLGLTYYGLDTIMKAIYPMVTDKTSQSDMANQMKYNFMNPLDTNAAFRLQWFGGWIYSRTGALPNGVNAYADTNLNTSTVFSVDNNSHLSFYSRTNISQISVDIGNKTSSFSNIYNLISIRRSDQSNITYYAINTVTGFATFVDSNSAAFYIDTRIGNITNGFRNGINRANNNSAPSTRPNLNIVLSALNEGGSILAGYYSSKQCAFASIGDGLTDSQAQIFSTLVNNLQKALNRAVY